MFLSKGTLIITLLSFPASAAIGRVSAIKVDQASKDELLQKQKYVPYKNRNSNSDSDIKTLRHRHHHDHHSLLLVSYRDDAGYGNVVSHAKKMEGQGKSVNVKKNFKFKTKHKVEVEKEKGKGKDVNNLIEDEEDVAFISGFSVVKAESDDIDAEIAALSALDGVTAVEEDTMVHILSTEYQQKLRGRGYGYGYGGLAEHVREIQDSIKTTADEIGDDHGRSLAEETPYGITMVNAAYVWNKEPPPPPPSSPKMKICVVDTGYDLGHEDLPNSQDHGVAGWHDDDGSFGLWDSDGHGHGTHCAGTIGAVGNNNKGVTSVNPDPDKFDFFIGKGLSDSGSGSNANVMNAVQACVNNGAKVISMSLGGSVYSSTTNAFYEEMYDSGVLIIAAAGNSGQDSWLYPAGYPVVMSVGSVTSSGSLSYFSTRNDQVEITGPGSDVKSTWPNNRYNTISGTSMACPHVAGVAALLWTHFPQCTNNQIRNAMIRSAAEPPASDSRNTAGWDKYFGWGTVDAQAAYDLLKSGCENAGGLADPPSGKQLHDLALGGKFQKDEGCTIDAHCDQFNLALGQYFCNTGTGTGSCERVVVPCTGVQKEVVVEIRTDRYPQETTWTLTDLCGYGESISGGPYSSRGTTYSSSNDVCEGLYQFQINDSYGDGICCGYGSGSYSVKYDGVEAASGGSFLDIEITKIGTACPSDPTPPPTTPPPTEPPTAQPTPVPTTAAPTAAPTTSPTAAPTTSPTPVPSAPPTASPTPVPTTAAPTPVPTTAAPTSAPTSSPTASPTTSTSPTPAPSAPPTSSPTPVPTTAAPTPVPTTAAPTVSPTSSPTASPSTPPTAAPTSAASSPTKNPTAAPTSSPQLGQLV